MYELLGAAGEWFGSTIVHPLLVGVLTLSFANLLNNVRRLRIAMRDPLVVAPAPAQVDAGQLKVSIVDRIELAQAVVAGV